MKMTKREKIIWAAGILEGEGCFASCATKKNGVVHYPFIKLSMTDKDVVARVAEILGHGKVYLRYSALDRARNHQPMYTLQVYGKAVVEEIMRSVLPYMGARRTARIKQLLSGDYRSMKQLQLDSVKSTAILRPMQEHIKSWLSMDPTEGGTLAGKASRSAADASESGKGKRAENVQDSDVSKSSSPGGQECIRGWDSMSPSAGHELKSPSAQNSHGIGSGPDRAGVSEGKRVEYPGKAPGDSPAREASPEGRSLSGGIGS